MGACVYGVRLCMFWERGDYFSHYRELGVSVFATLCGKP